MITYPKGVKTKRIATYRDEEAGVSIIVSRRTGGIGIPDYLVAGTNGFTATRKTQDKAIEAALTELARIKEKRDA
jgi:hypothetical protein